MNDSSLLDIEKQFAVAQGAAAVELKERIDRANQWRVEAQAKLAELKGQIARLGD